MGSGQSAAPSEPVRGPETRWDAAIMSVSHWPVVWADALASRWRRGVPCPQGAWAWQGQRAGHGSLGMNVTASGAAEWCGPRPIARRRAPRSRRWRGSAAAPPAGAARSRRRSRSGRGCAWRASARRCRVSRSPARNTVHPAGGSCGTSARWRACAGRCRRGRCAGRGSEPDPVSSGNATAAAAQPLRAGPAPVFLRWECARMLSDGSGRSRAGGAVMPWPLTLTRPVVSPWKVHLSSAATCVLAGTGPGISRTIVCK